MTYLVTGGTGFIGTYIVRLLVREGYQVVAYDAAPNRKLLELLMGKQESDLVGVIQGDITDLDHLVRTCQEYDVKKVIHMGAIVASEPVPLVVRVNCEGTVNVLETGRMLGLQRVVLASSLAVFGPADRHPQEYIPNDAPHSPSNIYGACKSLNEACAKHYFSEHGLDTIAIRLLRVYGFGRSRARSQVIHEELFVKPSLGKPGRVPYGDSADNWMYVEDAARVMVMASKVGMTKSRAFTANGDIRSTAEVAAYVKSQIPDADITLLPGCGNWPYKFDTTPVKEEIGYRPEWTIERGVKKYIEDIRKQNRICEKSL